MESIEHNVGDFAADDRRIFEKVLGHKLQENQRVIIQVMDIDASKSNGNSSQNHPSWTNLDDWAVLRADYPPAANLDLASLLSAAAVPEPSTGALVLLALVGSWLGWGRRR